MINFSINGYTYTPEFSTFPGGEEHVNIRRKRLPVCPEWKVNVQANITSSTELVRLLLVVNALRNQIGKTIQDIVLVMPYVPYARQDRICELGESFSLLVFANMINDMQFDSVFVEDCHSDVAVALLNNCINLSQVSLLSNTFLGHTIEKADYIVAPDLGATKKAEALGRFYEKPVLQCSKVRVNRDTIKVEVINPPKNLDKSVLVVVDDICDGGGTFLALAASPVIAEAKELHLIVTHGIFSKGKKTLLTEYNTVEALNDWTK